MSTIKVENISFKSESVLPDGYIISKEIKFSFPSNFNIKVLKQFIINKVGSTLASKFYNEDLIKEFLILALKSSYIKNIDETSIDELSNKKYQIILEVQNLFLKNISTLSLDNIITFRNTTEYIIECILLNIDYTEELIANIFLPEAKSTYSGGMYVGKYRENFNAYY